MNNVTAINTATRRAPMLDADNAATAWLWSTQSQRRATAIDTCIEHLMVDQDMTRRHAEDATIQAYAEMECRNKVHAIDTDSITSDLLVIKAPGGARIALTVVDLLAMLGQHNLEVANQETRRLLVLGSRK